MNHYKKLMKLVLKLTILLEKSREASSVRGEGLLNPV